MECVSENLSTWKMFKSAKLRNLKNKLRKFMYCEITYIFQCKYFNKAPLSFPSCPRIFLLSILPHYWFLSFLVPHLKWKISDKIFIISHHKKKGKDWKKKKEIFIEVLFLVRKIEKRIKVVWLYDGKDFNHFTWR